MRSTEFLDLFHHLGDGHVHEVAEPLSVRRAPVTTLRRRSIVGEEQHQGVVEYLEVTQRIDQPSDLGVGVVDEPAVGLLEAGKEVLRVVVEFVPTRDPRVAIRKTAISRDDPERLLPFEDAVALHIPSMVEAPSVGLDVLLRGVKRAVRRSEGHVGEKRPSARHLLLVLDHRDEVVDQVFADVVGAAVAALTRGRHAMIVDRDHRVPLIDLTRQEPIEAFEALAEGPTIERPCRGGLRGRGEVPLPGAVGRVAGLTEDLGDRCSRLGQERVRAGEAGCHLGNRGETDRVVVSAGQQGCSGR